VGKRGPGTPRGKIGKAPWKFPPKKEKNQKPKRIMKEGRPARKTDAAEFLKSKGKLQTNEAHTGEEEG